MDKLTVNGASLQLFRLGQQGPVILLVNGHMRAHTDFRMIARCLHEQGWQCISFDNRGSGGTTTSRDFSLQDMVEDVRAVLDHYQLEKVVLLGISMGGLIAQYFAGQYPERVTKLILVSTFAAKKYTHLVVDWGDSFATVFAQLSRYVSTPFLERNHLLIESMAKQMHRAIESGTFLSNAQRQRQALADATIDESLPELAKNYSAPVLIIHGADDAIINPATVETFRQLYPQAQARILDNAGHLLLAEKPKELQEAVISFLNS